MRVNCRPGGLDRRDFPDKPMGSERIYIKTAAGEEAIRRRTRLSPRSLRTVLILVDGKSTVADLARQTGKPESTESALLELEQSGYVELEQEQGASSVEATNETQETGTAAESDAVRLSPPSRGESEESPGVELSLSDIPGSNDPEPPCLSPAGAGFCEPAAATDLSCHPAGVEERGREESAGRSLADRFKAIFAFLPEPMRRPGNRKIGTAKLMAGGSAGFVALGLLTVLLFPYDIFRPDVEAALARATEQRAEVGSMRVEMFPRPVLVLGDVHLGSDGPELRLDQIRMEPVLGSLLQSRKVFREVSVKGGIFEAPQVAGVAAILGALAGPASGMAVEKLTFEDTELSFAGLGISGMEGEARLSADGTLESLAMNSRDGSLRVAMKPSAGKLDVGVEGLGWRPSEESPYRFDSLTVSGSIADGALTVTGMDLRLLDGKVQGGLVLRADKQPSIAGEVTFERINALRLGQALGLGQQFSGEIAGSARLSGTAEAWSAILPAARAEGEFSIHRGGVVGIDLAEAVRRVSDMPVQGGTTSFEQLSGHFRLAPAGYRFTGLILESGLMRSTGNVEINRDLRVDGRVELEMLGTANRMRVPIAIRGPLAAPEVQAGKRL